MTTLSPELVELGDALERAIAAGGIRSRGRVRRRLLLAAAALAVAIPGLAFVTEALIGPDEVAASLPAGTKMLAGTDPRCIVVRQDVEYHCVLSRPPTPELSDLKGVVEPTVDASRHVNGGCRSVRSDGLVWQCYIGRAAVEQQIVSADFLGEYAPAPGVG